MRGIKSLSGVSSKRIILFSILFAGTCYCIVDLSYTLFKPLFHPKVDLRDFHVALRYPESEIDRISDDNPAIRVVRLSTPDAINTVKKWYCKTIFGAETIFEKSLYSWGTLQVVANDLDHSQPVRICILHDADHNSQRDLVVVIYRSDNEHQTHIMMILGPYFPGEANLYGQPSTKVRASRCWARHQREISADQIETGGRARGGIEADNGVGANFRPSEAAKLAGLLQSAEWPCDRQ